ncbi:urea ABC transporter permease subunit UrtC [Merismopedia glauca]|uniref:Urea ABC transporter permease subunit UrtC n=1 Tax=Merismopedia glauca CCAP 1448/3 TaxID=1296344 RepID=A0A2T1BZ26_9CYAN|nr:urea ABC transporter permease subunit UrtC [Merismopedia glauca]PSB01194.1 urea ABC transporter permease subunit UrtC [Merismopedia glauca CCAP 1448/3]
MIVDAPPIVRGKPARKRTRLIREIIVVVAIALALIFLIPPLLIAVEQGSRVNLLGRFLALAIAALGIDLIWGYTGLLSLGHGIFFTLGGYALAMHLKLQIPPDASTQLPEFMSLYGVTKLPGFWEPFHSFGFSLLAVILIPMIVGGLLGYLIFRNRIKGVYFSIITQAATIVFFNLFNGQQEFFNGTNGLTDFKTLLGVDINSDRSQFNFYILTIVILAFAYAFCRWLTSGRLGNLLIAIRDDESRVRFSGYNPTEFKVLVFAISAGLAGIGGAMYTLQTGIIAPSNMDIPFSIEMVIWVAVGGRATLAGAVLGAVLVNLAKSFLSEQFADTWLFFLGGLFLIVVLVLPDGLVGWLREVTREPMQKLFRRPQPLLTYPSLETDIEVQSEREDLGN